MARYFLLYSRLGLRLVARSLGTSLLCLTLAASVSCEDRPRNVMQAFQEEVRVPFSEFDSGLEDRIRRCKSVLRKEGFELDVLEISRIASRDDPDRNEAIGVSLGLDAVDDGLHLDLIATVVNKEDDKFSVGGLLMVVADDKADVALAEVLKNVLLRDVFFKFGPERVGTAPPSIGAYKDIENNAP